MYGEESEDPSLPNAHFELTVPTSKLYVSHHNSLRTYNEDNQGSQHISKDASSMIKIDTHASAVLKARDKISILVNFLTQGHETLPPLMPEICTTKPYQDYLPRYGCLLRVHENTLKFLESYQTNIDSRPLHVAKSFYH
ncbi:hypothetical protein N7478_002830 [Penicillium angulare]|uniref:uncharacterized protein n=1 Tax=Penicillium angulare TaxID=116970 RepID=UPI00253FCD74|nr:uncharacterized protein N7478_002830 [Penicillium angulare]KAJ5287144.1 hypothetical protein N7478_002830 [Penicillium angulare]